ncbi:MAG: sulfurtransferase complex subunit TusB [Promethearchaeota archaeon]
MFEKLNIVYLYGYGPNEKIHVDTLVPLIKSQSANDTKVGIVLIHDGVIIASSKRKIDSHLKEFIELPITYYVMTSDLKARGIALDSISANMKAIEYGDLVDILDSSEKIISWM